MTTDILLIEKYENKKKMTSTTTEWERCQAALGITTGSSSSSISSSAIKDNDPTADDELESITNVTSIRTWDYSLPTLTCKRRYTSRRTFTSTSTGNNDFLDIIENHNNGLTHTILDSIGIFNSNTDVVLYGGSLLDIILQKEDTINDWDLRLIGQQYTNNEQLCIARSKEVVSIIFSCIRTWNEQQKVVNTEFEKNGEHRKMEDLFQINNIQTIRQNKTITIIIPSRGNACSTTTNSHHDKLCFQLTFEPYSTLQQLLSNCYPHCCRIAIQDNTVLVHKSARYFLESLCIVVTTDMLSEYVQILEEDCNVNDNQGKSITKTNEAKDEEHSCTIQLSLMRIQKMFDKGFDVILPDLDIGKVPKKNLKYNVDEVLDLPYMTIIYDSIINNKIMVKEIRCDNTAVPVVSNGYQNNSSSHSNANTENDGYNAGETIHHNIRCLGKGIYNQFQYNTIGDDYEQVIFNPVPQISARMIDKTYETVLEHLTTNNNDSIDIINTIISYFNTTLPHDVINILMFEPVRKLVTTINNNSSLHKNTVSNKFIMNTNDIEKLIEIEKRTLIEEKLVSLEQIMSTICKDSIIPIIGGKLQPMHQQKINTNEKVLLEAFYGSYQNSNKNTK